MTGLGRFNHFGRKAELCWNKWGTLFLLLAKNIRQIKLHSLMLDITWLNWMPTDVKMYTMVNGQFLHKCIAIQALTLLALCVYVCRNFPSTTKFRAAIFCVKIQFIFWPNSTLYKLSIFHGSALFFKYPMKRKFFFSRHLNFLSAIFFFEWFFTCAKTCSSSNCRFLCTHNMNSIIKFRDFFFILLQHHVHSLAHKLLYIYFTLSGFFSRHNLQVIGHIDIMVLWAFFYSVLFHSASVWKYSLLPIFVLFLHIFGNLQAVFMSFQSIQYKYTGDSYLSIWQEYTHTDILHTQASIRGYGLQYSIKRERKKHVKKHHKQQHTHNIHAHTYKFGISIAKLYHSNMVHRALDLMALWVDLGLHR